MARSEHGIPTSPQANSALNPDTLGFIERISWFERQQPRRADNDNMSTYARQEQGSACFDSWALPDYMRH